MFDEISLKKIDAKYFNIILLDNKDITLQSRNTGHYWYLHCTEYPEEQSLIIFHKHFFQMSISSAWKGEYTESGSKKY